VLRLSVSVVSLAIVAGVVTFYLSSPRSRPPFSLGRTGSVRAAAPREGSTGGSFLPTFSQAIESARWQRIQLERVEAVLWEHTAAVLLQRQPDTGDRQ